MFLIGMNQGVLQGIAEARAQQMGLPLPAPQQQQALPPPAPANPEEANITRIADWLKGQGGKFKG